MSPLALQALGGILLAALVAWQLVVGLRWIDLGKKRVRIHRISGIVLAVLVVPHMLMGLWLAFGWFAPLFRPLFG